MRALAGLGAFLLGMVICVATVALMQSWPGWILGVVTTFAVLHALTPGFRLRGLAAIGWVVAVVAVVLGRPEGDYAIAANAQGDGLLVVGALTILYAAATLP